MNIKYLDLNQTEIIIDEDTQYVALFIGKNSDEINSKIKFVHNKEHITSNILIKAVLFDNSKFEIFGDLVIKKGAKYTDSYLKMDVLLMSEKASAKVVPSLEITENDVKGGHGASVGPVDPEQLFYLESRGIGKMEAEKLLSEGFIQDAVQKFGDDIPSEIEVELAKLG